MQIVQLAYFNRQKKVQRDTGMEAQRGSVACGDGRKRVGVRSHEAEVMRQKSAVRSQQSEVRREETRRVVNHGLHGLHGS